MSCLEKQGYIKLITIRITLCLKVSKIRDQNVLFNLNLKTNITFRFFSSLNLTDIEIYLTV